MKRVDIKEYSLLLLHISETAFYDPDHQNAGDQ